MYQNSIRFAVGLAAVSVLAFVASEILILTAIAHGQITLPW